MSLDTDIAIIGGGPVGAALALALQRLAAAQGAIQGDGSESNRTA